MMNVIINEGLADLNFIEERTEGFEKIREIVTTVAGVGTKVSEGETRMPFHFYDGNPNELTNAALDKFARIPEYKVCAVKMEKL